MFKMYSLLHFLLGEAALLVRRSQVPAPFLCCHVNEPCLLSLAPDNLHNPPLAAIHSIQTTRDSLIRLLVVNNTLMEQGKVLSPCFWEVSAQAADHCLSTQPLGAPMNICSLEQQ